ncbi:hypothetical protein PYW08_002651 [Mythimna loreyi]|uniref:Uncharacterized protein n=1 Tax=Mythimna loreyi TaxID=667449 RepID=A0ACC2QNM1_9NEOP|nr:hypothetical protein PYW08_002651 [Mythimna loreyi]
MSLWEVKDKSFLITGGASGLGAEYAQTFLNEGAKNVAILDIAEQLGKATAERLNKAHGDKALFIKCDVSKEEDITSAFDSVLAQFKQIDVIINNAGVMVDAPDTWRIASDINWQGVVSLTMKGLKHMRKDEGGLGGTIINISSTAALTKFQAFPIYSGSKMAVLHFSQSLAVDPFYENTGIRVLTLCLGPTDTRLLDNLEAKSYDPKIGKILTDIVEATGVIYQKPASAVAGVLHMFKNGSPGSSWLVNDGKPAEDITPAIDRAFKDLESLLLP